MTADLATLTIDYLGGNCPVQAEGTVDGREFYFRSRGTHWSMSIGGSDLVGAPEWYYEERYGDWPSAGWITEDEARAFMDKAFALYRAALIAQAQTEEARHDGA